jgi:hypothetical protein
MNLGRTQTFSPFSPQAFLSPGYLSQALGLRFRVQMKSHLLHAGEEGEGEGEGHCLFLFL